MRSFLATLLLIPVIALAEEPPALEPVPLAGTGLEQWEVQRADIIRRFELVAGPLPRPGTPVSLEPKILEEVELEKGIVRRKISYHTDSAEASHSAYILIPPTEPGQTRPAVIVFHSTQSAGKRQPAGLTEDSSKHIALHLALRGYVTIAPDYPSFGEFEHDFAADDYDSGAMLAIYHNIRSIDLLIAQPEVDAERIGAIGHSLGGHTSIFTALFDPRIKAVVSNCGFTRFHRYYEGDLTGWTSPRYFPRIASEFDQDPDQMPFDFPELIAALAPRPFLASSPIHDDNFDVTGVAETMAAASSAYELHGAAEALRSNYPDCEHAFPPEVRDVAYAFLDEYLKPGKRGG